MQVDERVGSPEALLDRSGRKILAWLSVGLAALMTYFIMANPFGKSGETRAFALTTTALALTPLALWLAHPSKKRIPALELHGLFYGLCFGMAGFVTPARYMGSIQANDHEYLVALATTTVSLLSCYTAYALGVRLPTPRLPRWMRRDDSRIHTVAVTVLVPLTLATRLVIKEYNISNVSQTVNTIQVATFLWVLYAAWSGRLSRWARRAVLCLYLPTQFLVSSGLGSGVLAPLMVTGQLVGITFIAVKKRLPLALVGTSIVIFVLLQPVKLEYRDLAWKESAEVAESAGAMDFLRLAFENIASGDPWQSMADNLESSYTRINHLHLTAAIIADTPSTQPYRWGETYLPLFTKWIPRAIWPEKPREDLGNRWAQDYGYLFYSDDITSFNLPWLPEMYMNFGVGGVVAISALVGGIMALVWAASSGHTNTPIGFAVGLVLCSSFFFPESNLSLHIGDLVIATMGLFAYVGLASLFLPERRSTRGAGERQTLTDTGERLRSDSST
jgi:hypothetical protein